MKTLIIVGGRFEKEFAASFLTTKKYDYIIAVDKGLKYAEELGVIPNLIVGDFDSYGEIDIAKYEKQGIQIRSFNPQKDDTDTEIAIREAASLGKDMEILCATGGRFDHQLASIHNLLIALESGVDARIIDECNVIYLRNTSFTMESKECFGKYVSFIPFDGTVKNIKLKGFKYTLDGYDLKPGSSRCVSNEIVDSKAYVSFDSGCLIVVESLDVESK